MCFFVPYQLSYRNPLCRATEKNQHPGYGTLPCYWRGGIYGLLSAEIGKGPVTLFRATVAPSRAWRGSRFRVDRATREITGSGGWFRSQHRGCRKRRTPLSPLRRAFYFSPPRSVRSAADSGRSGNCRASRRCDVRDRIASFDELQALGGNMARGKCLLRPSWVGLSNLDEDG